MIGAFGDALILFPDGYVDQFGGSQNGKFLMAWFLALLEKQASLPMPALGQWLYENFRDWRSTHK